ncbi:uncharacterized protein LOC116171056 [Photinus pyralis]|nr:uncharacterized protein LOC116171056 [Photinus pyralis]
MLSIRNLCFVIVSLCCSIHHGFCKDVDNPVTINCYNCLCQAATGCNFQQSCHENSCGPLAFSKEYWNSTNRPTVNRVPSSAPEAFEVCARSLYCSYFMIQRYMEKHKKDCNGDGKIDCDDFVAIHKLGPDNCDQELPESYAERYDYCQSLVL